MKSHSAQQGAPSNVHSFNTPLERQKSVRRSVICAATLCVGHVEFRCQVLNVSDGGAKLRLRSGGFEPIYVGTTVFLWVKSIGAISAKIMWYEGSHVGVKFLGDPARAPRLVRNFLRNPNSIDERRGLTRTSVQWLGRCHINGQSTSVLIHDVSLGGAKIQLPDQVTSLEDIELEIGGIGIFACTLVWNDMPFAGLAFEDSPDYVDTNLGPYLDKK